MHAEDLVNDGVEIVQASTVRELLPGWIGIRELLLQLLAEAFLHLRLARKLDKGPLIRRESMILDRRASFIENSL